MALPRNAIFTFSGQLRLKHLLLRAFLDECLPEALSKVDVLDGAVLQKSKKHRTIERRFLTFVGQLHLKHLLLRAFLEGIRPEMLSKVGF